jgi:ketosteroid isomerase-like protein
MGASILSAQEPSAALPPVSEPQKSIIQKEVRQVAWAWVQANERADARAVLGFYAAHAEFPLMYADSEGRLMDFEGLQKNTHEGLDGSSQITIVLRKEMVTVLSADTALWAFQGTWRGSLKTGVPVPSETCAVSLLFKRMGGDWKIVYHHESSPEPAEAKFGEARSKGR